MNEENAKFSAFSFSDSLLGPDKLFHNAGIRLTPVAVGNFDYTELEAITGSASSMEYTNHFFYQEDPSVLADSGQEMRDEMLDCDIKDGEYHYSVL